MLVDSSILLPIFRDKSGSRRDRFRRFLRGRDYSLTRITQIELLQGCKSQEQWDTFDDYLQVQSFVEMTPDTWQAAARILFDLGRAGKTIKILDCCIAQIAIENRVHLVHNDTDFEMIGELRKIKLHRLDIQAKG